MKKVSAIIVNWNGKDVTLHCIESLLKQDYSHLEIIVSDNGSTDGSQEIIRERFPQILLLENKENLGFGRAVNRGIQAASGDYFIFLNNDLYLKEDSIRQLANLLDANPKTGAVVPKILFFEKRDTINSFGVLVHYTSICCPNMLDEKDSNNLKTRETACGGIFMFRRKIYESIGGFDDDLFLYHEDHDLSWRIRLHGWKIQVTPDAILYHHYHFNKGIRKFYSSEKNRLLLLLKNLQGKTLVLIAPGLFLIECAQIIHSLINGWFCLKIKSYFELLGLARMIFRKRHQLKLTRTVTDREIVRLYQGTLRVSGMQNPLFNYVLSPVLNAYWIVIRRMI